MNKGAHPDINDTAREHGFEEVRARHDRAHASNARAARVEANNVEIHLEDFVAYLPRHNYIFIPTREPWPATSVNARITPVSHGSETIPASIWLDKNRPVEQMN